MLQTISVPHKSGLHRHFTNWYKAPGTPAPHYALTGFLNPAAHRARMVTRSADRNPKKVGCHHGWKGMSLSTSLAPLSPWDFSAEATLQLSTLMATKDDT